MSAPQTLLEARAAIEEILESLPDHVLPKPDKIEPDDYAARNGRPGLKTAWFGGHGYCLAQSRRGDTLIPGGWYRETGAWNAIVGEAVRRLDLRMHDELADAGEDEPKPWETREADERRLIAAGGFLAKTLDNIEGLSDDVSWTNAEVRRLVLDALGEMEVHP